MTMAENAPPSSLPSTFSRASSTAAISSSTLKTKSKRWSLNIASPQPTSAPRPLHLSAGLVVGSSPNSPSHSPSPGNSQLPSAGSSKGGGVGIDSPGSSSHTPSPSPSMTNLRRPSGTGRRQSSISYIPSNFDSPSRPNFSKRDSVDSLGLVRSPLSSSTTSFSNFDGGESRLERSHSLGGRRSKPPRSPAAGERSSTGTLVEAKAQEVKDRPPVTLAEKHSELLHFIAQKESKCLELRSQLSVHEAELLQLKRKWERIVNRGFERTLSPSNSNSASTISPTLITTLQTTTTSASSSPSSTFHPYSSSSNASSSATTAGLAPGGGVDGMLEGIKGGVQGMSRFIAAGLGSIAQVVPAEQAQAQSGSSAPLPLMLGGTTSTRGSGGSKRMSLTLMNGSLKGINGSGHGQKESQSSTSTTSSAASSSLLSASSGTSATSASASISGSSTSGNTTKRTPPSSELEMESEFGDFEDGLSAHSHYTQHEQVLMVHDTGATPTMSPNPAFQRRQRSEDNDNQAPNLDFQQHFGDGGEEKEEFDWDDGWEESTGERDVTMSLGSSGVIATESKPAAVGPTTTTTSRMVVGAHAGPKSPLAPMSAIPTGLASIAGAAPTAQQMSSWVGSVGKRWDEITGSTTFTKNQKRASLLFSDMQQSLVSALASPSTASAPGTSVSVAASASSTVPYYSVPPTTASGNVSSAPSSSSKMHSAFQLQPRTQRGMSTSLLDDSDDESFGESGADAGGDNTVRLAPVMVPDSKGVTGANQGKEKAKTKVEDEDEWNW